MTPLSLGLICYSKLLDRQRVKFVIKMTKAKIFIMILYVIA